MSTVSRFLLAIIRVYQCTLSSFMGKSCRYHPTCSVYTAESIRRFGAFRGSWLGVKRICRCHPYNDGGYDPVPEKKASVPSQMKD
ncbi:MAG: membrane protein insertion efficiency factor YidD [Alphaproteobacteria bacterium]|nr:membrane protein insertion efficiency factor YidD [Alphaproteobacteria bacterium]MCK5518483.1 membrane protein insertion efficiency factor YidD [Alphaproteobacteria bacterium]MCK5554632.1 membrane protein insertion efficiency factor YidD [Alphaproteobacteria bacterium]MCK5659418.1 membrane protein insertion efficiency factor YidD [Alphaproteobacteria bacterium]